MVDTARARAEAALRRDATLEALAFAAQRFLETPEWEGVVGQMLRRLGEAVAVSRVYIFENRTAADGTLLVSQRHEWVARGVEPQMDNPDLQDAPLVARGYGRWVEVLGRGDLIIGPVEGFPDPERERLALQGVKSILVVPIFVHGTWWGFIGFDDCASARVWSQIEIDALRAVAGTLGAAIHRKRTEERLREAEARYRTLVEQIPAITYQERVTDEYEAASSMVYVSPQIEDVLGYPAANWSTIPGFWTTILHPDDRERVLAESTRTSLSGEPYSQEYRMLAADGRVVWFHDDAVLIRDEEGRPKLWQGVMVDITERRRAEEALEEAEAKYRALVEQNPAVIYTQVIDEADPSTARTVYISPQAEALLGYTVEETLANPLLWTEILHPDDRERVLAEDAAGNASGEPFHMEYRMIARDGRVVWIHDEATVVRDAQGRPRFWQGFMLDITERKRMEEQLKESEARYRDLFENANDLIYTHDLEGNVTSINNAAERLIGYGRDEVLGTDITRFVAPEDRPLAREMIARALAGADLPAYEIEVVVRDGRRIPIEINTRLIRRDGEPVGVQGIARDITERKRAEQDLERALEVERESIRRLRALDEMKNTFLQAVSHDLRTPLAAILGLAVTLERGDIELETSDVRDLATRIATNARKLDRLVTDLLDLDRLARGIVEPKLHPTDVGALVRRVVSESALLGERHVQVEAEPVVIEVDAAKVERIVENLLANTARHTPPDAGVWVKVSPEEGGVLIAVEDEGPGVPEEHREGIFEPFRQGPEAPTHSPGVGGGLALVARFAEIHGGRAWVEDRQGGGASFRVFLPGEGSG